MPKTKTKPAHRAALIEKIEHALTNGLTHPGTGDGPIALPLPMFNNGTMPGEMARQFAEDAGLPHANAAKLVAEALVSLLENAGTEGTAVIRQAANTPTPEPTPGAKTSPRRGPKPIPAPAAAPSPQPSIPAGDPTGRMIVTLNGETLMRDLGDWKQHQPAQIAEHLKNPVKAPAWAKALIAAIVDTATTGRAQHVDITTDDHGGWTMQVSAA